MEEEKPKTQVRDMGKCIQEATAAFKSGSDLYHQFTSQNPDIQAILSDAENLYTDISEMVQDCIPHEKTRSFAKMMAFSPPVDKPASIGGLSQCVQEAAAAIKSGSDLYQQITSQSPDINAIITDAEDLYTELTEMTSDCLNMDLDIPTFGSLTGCIQDAEALIGTGLDFYHQVTASPKDWGKIIKDAEALYPEITKLLQDCKALDTVAPMLLKNDAPANDCTSDATNLINAGYKFYTDYQAGHIIKYIFDMKNVLSDIGKC